MNKLWITLMAVSLLVLSGCEEKTPTTVFQSQRTEDSQVVSSATELSSAGEEEGSFFGISYDNFVSEYNNQLVAAGFEPLREDQITDYSDERVVSGTPTMVIITLDSGILVTLVTLDGQIQGIAVSDNRMAPEDESMIEQVKLFSFVAPDSDVVALIDDAFSGDYQMATDGFMSVSYERLATDGLSFLLVPWALEMATVVPEDFELTYEDFVRLFNEMLAGFELEQLEETEVSWQEENGVAVATIPIDENADLILFLNDSNLVTQVELHYSPDGFAEKSAYYATFLFAVLSTNSDSTQLLKEAANSPDSRSSDDYIIFESETEGNRVVLRYRTNHGGLSPSTQ